MRAPISTREPNPTLSFRLSKPRLIRGPREWGYFLAAALLLFLFSVGWRYMAYRSFTAHKSLKTDATVLLHYTKTKGSRRYDVLKMQEGLHTFYTVAWKPLSENLRGRRVKLLLFPGHVGFLDFLGTPFIPSKMVGSLPKKDLRFRLYDRIAAQHQNPLMQELYGALFLALPVSKTLRDAVSRLGVNHLLALSGFHMGLLWAILYWGLGQLYAPLQRRFFPWRHRLLDVGAVTLLLLGGYLMLTGMPPSLLRAYAMVAVGWLALLFGIELLSFSFLAFCVTLLVAFFPGLVLSVGFWLSVAGVFAIYLFLHRFGSWPKWAITAGINLWVWLFMLPIVHLLFPLFSPAQLLSPILTALFVIYYPLEMGLHWIGLGGLGDGVILSLLRWAQALPTASVSLPWWAGVLYAVLSLLAVRVVAAIYLPMLFAGLFLLYLVEQVA